MRQPKKVNESHIDQYLEMDLDLALGNAKSVVLDAAIDVAALIDAVCCQVGERVDRDPYEPNPEMTAGGREESGALLRLALARGDHGLRAGGYIEVRVLPEKRLVEADGGYYDKHYQPQRIIHGSLHWREVSHESVGQALLLAYDRVVRAYMVREEPGDGFPPHQKPVGQAEWYSAKQSTSGAQASVEEGIRL